MLLEKHPWVGTDVWNNVVCDLLNPWLIRWESLIDKAEQALAKVTGQLKWFDGFDKQGAEDRIAHLRSEPEGCGIRARSVRG